MDALALPTGGLTRRQLLEFGAVGTLAALAARVPDVLSSAAGQPALAPAAPRHLTRTTYAPLVGDRFTIARPGARPVAVRLVEVRDLGRHGGPLRGLAGHEEAFALRFHGPRAPRVGQGVHRLRHPALGRVDLLLAPSGTGRRGQDYEAVINRVHPG